jgi:Ca-activated chloride channel family protein
VTFAAPLWFVALPAALTAAALVARAHARDRLRLPGELGELARGDSVVGRAARGWRRGAEWVGLLLLVLALALPRVEREQGAPPKPAICVVDVSRSMLAEDEGGASRFARAKVVLRQALAAMEGRRVGLITFAGAAEEVAPPTTDLAALRALLEEIDPRRVADPGSVAGAGVEKAIERLKATGGELLLFSDGEWQVEGAGEPALVAAALAAHVAIDVVPLGGEAPITLVARDAGGNATPLVDAEGRPAVTRAERPRMVALAKATHGRALEGRLGAADFAFAAPRQIEAAESPRGLTLESALLAAALALFAAAHALRERVP